MWIVNLRVAVVIAIAVVGDAASVARIDPAATLAASPTTQQVQPDAAKSEQALHGHWQPIQMIWEGQEVEPASLKKLELVISKGLFSPTPNVIQLRTAGKDAVSINFPPLGGPMKLDFTKDPRTILILLHAPDDRGYVHPLHGIWKLEGDLLTVSFGDNKAPPRDFSGKNALHVAVYKRMTGK